MIAVVLIALTVGAVDPMGARRLAHLLSYVAADYENAVADGKVTSAFEHEEQLTLLDTSAALAHEAGVPDLAPAIQALRARVAAAAPNAEVEREARALRRAVVRAARLSLLPPGEPDLAHGEAMYREHCAKCHGLTGRADTPQALGLKPPPVPFSDPLVGESLSPLSVADTLLFGVEGTAMVPFTFLSEAERWDLAFYAAALRHTPRAWPSTPRWSMEELAMRTDGELLDTLHAAGVGPRDLGNAAAELRRSPASEGTGAMMLLRRARAALGQAEQALAWGERARAAALVGEAHWRNVAPALPMISVWDVSVAAELSERLLAFRQRIGTEEDAALDRDLGVLYAVITRAQLVVARAGVEAPVDDPTLSGLPRREAPAPAPGKTLYLVALAATRVWFWPAVGVLALLSLGRPCRRALPSALIALGVGLIVGALSIEEIRALGLALAALLLASAALPLVAVARAERRALLVPLGIGTLLTPASVDAAELATDAAARAPSFAVGGGLLVAALVLLGLVVEGAGLLARVAPTRVLVALAGAASAVLAGRAVASMQMHGVAPARVLDWIGWPGLGIHPTVETCAAQILVGVLAMVLMRRAARGSGALPPGGALRQPPPWWG